MKLLIDANIIIDVLQNRQPYVETSKDIWKLCETKQVQGYVSTLTFANLVYILRKELTPGDIDKLLKILSLIFEIIDLNQADLFRATSIKWKDFEDAIQNVTAEKIQADFIITRNTKDFSKSNIPALTPSEFLVAFCNAELKN